MQFWLLLCVIAGMSWAWSVFAAVKKVGAPWSGAALGLIVGIGLFVLLRTSGARAIQCWKLYEPRPPASRLFVAWLMCGATLLFSFIAPWGINWFLKFCGLDPNNP